MKSAVLCSTVFDHTLVVYGLIEKIFFSFFITQIQVYDLNSKYYLVLL